MLAALVKKEFFKNHVVLVQTVRYRRVNLRKPIPPHFESQKVQKAVKPWILKPYDFDFPSFVKCRKPLMALLKERTEENPYERILANELLDLFEKSEMILFFHRNPCTSEEFYGSIKTFKKANMELVNRSKTTVQMAVENTKYLPIMNLYQSHTLTLCSPSIQLDVVFKLLKKMPQFILLGGIVENRFVNKNKLEEYSKLPGLDGVRGQFVTVLNSAARQFTEHINRKQTDLITNLDSYTKL